MSLISVSARRPLGPSKPTDLPSCDATSPPSCHTSGQMRHTVSSSPTPGQPVPNVPLDLSVIRLAVARKSSHVQPA